MNSTSHCYSSVIFHIVQLKSQQGVITGKECYKGAVSREVFSGKSF